MERGSADAPLRWAQNALRGYRGGVYPWDAVAVDAWEGRSRGASECNAPRL